MPSATDADIVSHPEGNTPLLARETIARWAERRLMAGAAPMRKVG